MERRLYNLKWLVVLPLYLTGCFNDDLKTAEAYIAAGEYAAAVQVLSNGVKTGGARHYCLLAQALLVEGETQDGFKALDQARQQGAGSEEIGRTLLESAKVIVREKERCYETATLLDSALKYEPSLKEAVLDLIWTRSLEYLQVPGDGALHLIRRAEVYDPYILGRLKGYDTKLAMRYEEMKAVYQILAEVSIAIQNFTNNKSALPSNIMELCQSSPELMLKTNRAGWRFYLVKGRGKVIPQAEALLKNPAGVIVGTVISYYE